ncbi:hypothetical protein EV356DRAFT_40249 [Viridothelium virens]|uniref:Uncharacterized protein n=1 Tax=Viridothelium virens TaxID=1048519 RepID=A0A6A6HFS8_VIRVR|nr:hypothetical protein EV356DRAFT_40249 [Viridothelium virens]
MSLMFLEGPASAGIEGSLKDARILGCSTVWPFIDVFRSGGSRGPLLKSGSDVAAIVVSFCLVGLSVLSELIRRLLSMSLWAL